MNDVVLLLDGQDPASSYRDVAQPLLQQGGKALGLVQRLKALQDHSAHSAIQGQPAPFVTVVTSSGTGKTQFSTTSKVAFQDDDKVHVVYLYMGQGDAETVQPFYKPHTVFGSV